MSVSTASAASSPLKKVINAQESRTLAAISAVFFLALHFLERFHQRQGLVFPAQAFDVGAGDGFEQDAFGRGDDRGARAFLDLKFLPQPARNHYLAFRAEIDRLCLDWCNHAMKLH